MSFLQIITTKYLVTIILSTICLIVVFNNCYGEKEIPQTKIGNGFINTHSIKFLYCYSCGYRKLYEDYSHILKQKYPNLIVEGENYDPPGMNMFLARLVGGIKIALIVLILSNYNVFQLFGQPIPELWVWCTTNKLYASMMIFLLSNIVEGQLVASGAFEIILNNVPVWSKLETGRVPDPAELFQIIDNHLQFESAVEYTPGFPK